MRGPHSWLIMNPFSLLKLFRRNRISMAYFSNLSMYHAGLLLVSMMSSLESILSNVPREQISVVDRVRCGVRVFCIWL
jgi:hypothetical protein